MGVQICPERDALLTDFGKTTLEDRYLQPGESYQGLFARVAEAYADNPAHAQRMYDYISSHWFMPATPVLANGGLESALPISCYLNSVEDTMTSILDVFHETGWLSCQGGGVGTYWGKIREVGSTVRGRPDAEGVVPWMNIQDSYARAVNQGSVRNASVAFYLDIDHPEIEAFIDIRRVEGDLSRKTQDSHHGVMISDAFMEAVIADDDYDLVSPKTGLVTKTIRARPIWTKILDVRMTDGEPYLIFKDAVNRSAPAAYKELGLTVSQSNLCTEIMLTTGPDHLNKERTAVCCLSSVNALYYPEWSSHPTFIEDCYRFLDNVLQDFIDRAPLISPWFSKAVYAAQRGRDVGLGLMGFHSLLLKQRVPFGSAMAKALNLNIFKTMAEKRNAANVKLANEKGPCPDAVTAGLNHRFNHGSAIAPTASISVICGGVSAGIEPIPALAYVHKTLSGSALIKNPFFQQFLDEWFDLHGPELAGELDRDAFNEEIWDYVHANKGSIQNYPRFSEEDKEPFKTAFEIDQRWVVELANDRGPYLDQGQSVNLFFPGDAAKADINEAHLKLWRGGGKSAYYLRSTSVVQARTVGHDSVGVPDINYDESDECLACQ